MAAANETMHTLDDDVTFERMKKNAKKSTLYSNHRKLSWQCDRDVKQFEKDRNLTTFGLAREKTSMIERLAKLQEAQKEIESRRHSEPSLSGRRGRRSSEPCIALADIKKLESVGESMIEAKTTENSVPSKRMYARRNTVAEGMGEKGSLPLLRRLTAPSLGSSLPPKRKESLEERQISIPEEAA